MMHALIRAPNVSEGSHFGVEKGLSQQDRFPLRGKKGTGQRPMLPQK